MGGELRYAAFISHASADGPLAAWLKRSLEAYEVPDGFVGRAGSAGPISKRLGTVASGLAEGKRELDAEIRAALDRSEALIVLRPKRGGQSDHASEEIRYFKSLGRGERIVTVHTAGERHAAAHESFIWRKLVDADGPPHAEGESDTGDKPDGETAIADLRGGAHKRKGGRLRIIANLIGVGLHELVEHERVAERARGARLAAVGAAAFVVCLSAGGVAWLSVNRPQQAAKQSVQVASAAPARVAEQPGALQPPAPAAAPALATKPEPVAPRPVAPAPAKQSAPVAAQAVAPAPARAHVRAAPVRTNQPAAIAAARPAAPAASSAKQPALAAARPAAPARTNPPTTIAAARPAATPPARTSPPTTVAAARPAATAPARMNPPAAVAASQPAAPARAPVAVASAQPATPVSRPQIEQPATAPPVRQEPATPIVQASAPAEAGPQSTLLQQLRDLGAAQAVAVRCEGRANQASRNRAQTLIGSSPQTHQAALIGAFNDGYRSAEGRADACPVQPTSG